MWIIGIIQYTLFWPHPHRPAFIPGVGGEADGLNQSTSMMTTPRRQRAASTLTLAAAVGVGLSLLGLVPAGRAQTILQNFAGVNLSNTFALRSQATPPDTMGTIGPDNFVEFINGAYASYSRTGALQGTIATDTAFWTAAGISPAVTGAGLSDPRIIFDPGSQRWFATQINVSATGNQVLLARTNGTDPSVGNWVGTNFTLAPGNQFADYPTLGVDSRGVFVGSNNFNATGTAFTGVSLASIPKADLLLAAPSVANRTTFNQATDSPSLGFTLQGVTNAAASGTSSVLAASATAFNQVNLTRINGPQAAGATLSATTVVATAFDGNPTLVRQPDGTRQVDGLDQRFSASVVQVGNKIYAVNSINNGNFGSSPTAAGFNSVHWLVLDATTNATLAEGLIQDGAHDYFQPSIAANASGNIVIGFNRAGAGASPGDNLSSFAAIGRTDANGNVVFDAPILLAQGVVGNYHLLGGPGERWGDYSATTVDPLDPTKFWTIQEIPLAKVDGQDRWGTQITEIAINAVPEPAVAWLTLLGGAGLAGWARRRRQVGGLV